jgi:methanogenic corrinoid protein MtbC1
MLSEDLVTRYLGGLLEGDRIRCRAVVEELLQSGVAASRVYFDLIWPLMVELEKLGRADKITPLQEHLATRINRTIVDQLQNKLPRRAGRGRKVVICTGQTDCGELGGQVLADLFETNGWEVRLTGGGVSNDDLLVFLSDYRPDVLLIYGSTASEAPQIRRLIDTVRVIGASPMLRIMLSGGLFSRAEGLWEEIGADLFAADAIEALNLADDDAAVARVQPQRMIKRRRKRQLTVAAAQGTDGGSGNDGGQAQLQRDLSSGSGPQV